MEVAIIIVVVLLVLASVFRGAAAGGAVSCLGAIGVFGGAILFAVFMGMMLWATSRTGFWLAMGTIGACISGIVYWAVRDYWVTKREANFKQPLAARRREMIAESEELKKGVYRHPTGVFIARGPRGGTRVFQAKSAAENYAKAQSDSPNDGRRLAPPLEALLEEAVLIDHQIYHHPDGTYVLIRENGSLSAFRSLDRARLHRDDPSLFQPKTEAGT